ncbi:MAG TPA: hypothetical protein DDW73_07580 [Rhizobium sp.]|nr:hypothetical protein [Rhizobium sp.]
MAALAYAVMPINGMAAQTFATPDQHQMHGMNHDGDGCADHHNSHKHNAIGCGHCAACLTLPAMIMEFDTVQVVRAAPKPGLVARLLSQNNLPLVPPPRS